MNAVEAQEQPRGLYSRKQAAQWLSISTSTLDLLISQGQLRFRRCGRRVLISHGQLVRFASKDTIAVWPAKQNGKTTRRPSFERNGPVSVH
jgi:excisionase family DNA binding protein